MYICIERERENHSFDLKNNLNLIEIISHQHLDYMLLLLIFSNHWNFVSSLNRQV